MLAKTKEISTKIVNRDYLKTQNLTCLYLPCENHNSDRSHTPGICSLAGPHKSGVGTSFILLFMGFRPKRKLK